MSFSTVELRRQKIADVGGAAKARVKIARDIGRRSVRCPAMQRNYVIAALLTSLVVVSVQPTSAQTRPTTSRTATTQPHPRAEWGAPLVDVKRDGDTWTIAGRKQTFTLNGKDLSMSIKSGGATWAMMPSVAGDLIVKAAGKEFPARLADASKIDVVPYDTGYKTGVKLTLSGWKDAGELTLFLTVALEGKDEELVADVAADESRGAIVRRLDWPGPLDAREIDHTLLSNHRGVLLPRTWDRPYFPIRSTDMGGNAKVSDTSEIQSNVIESWSMSWWGFQKGE